MYGKYVKTGIVGAGERNSIVKVKEGGKGEGEGEARSENQRDVMRVRGKDIMKESEELVRARDGEYNWREGRERRSVRARDGEV